MGDSPTGLVVGRADACTMVCVCRCWLDRLLGAGAVACVEAFAGPRVSAVSRAVVGVAGLALSGVALGRFQGHRAGALLSRTCTTEVCLHWQCGPRGLCGAEFVGLGLSRLAVLRVGLCTAADHVAARDAALDGREAALAPLERAMEAGRVAARDATACMATLERTIRRLLDPAAVVAALAGVGVCGGRGTVAASAA